MRKKISRIKRGLAVMLSVCMVFGMAPIQAGAEENDSEIAVQANDSAGKTEQQSTEEEECKHEGVEITFNSNGFGNCPKCNATVYQPEKLPVGVGITANAENSEIVESNSWLEVSCAENNYKTIDYTSSDENTYTCYVYSSTEYSAVLISVNGWSHVANNGVLGYDNQVADLASKGARMPKFAELQILLDAGMNLTKFDNFNCQEYEVAWVENGKWRGQKGNNKYADSTYHAVFEINRNPIETVSDSIFKTDSSPTLSAVKGEDFTWQGNCDIEISYYNSDKTICDSAPAAAGDYYVKVSTPTIEADEDGNTVRYEASESDYIPFTIVHNFPDTFDSNGFKNCPKCNATVYQPATETTDKYDIDDDSTKDTVYEISNAGQLYWFAGLVNGTLDGVKQNTLANAILTANITVNDNLLDSLQYDTEGNVSNGSDFITWTPIADCMEDHITLYSGTFDGNNKTVSGLYFNDNSTRIGLFGSSEADGNIKNVGVVDSYFKGNDFVGGVCGRNDGTITNCYNAGNLTVIESSATIGGICGYNSGTVTNCYNTGTVTATGHVASVGGVCGCSTAPISNCYNIGTVTATSSSTDISDICGYNFGPVTNCYYLADTEDENGGKTTAQFASGEVAYLLSQGCIVGEGENAVTYSGSVWGQKLGENGDTYPVLKKAGDAKNTVYRNETYPGCEGKPGDLVYSYSNTQKAPTYAEHTDEDLDGKCDICKLDFKTFEQLGLLIAKVNKNLSDGKYADVQYTTASIDNLRTALVAAGAVTEASSDTDVATAFDKLLAASTVGADGLIAADHNIVISFADAKRGIASGNGWYANGDTVTLKVTPSVGYSFSKWTTDTAGNTPVGTESTYTFTLGADSPDAYYAWLDEIKYTVKCKSTEGGTCTTSTSDGKYVYGQTATVTATVSAGYEFVGWKDIYGTTVSTDANYSFTVIGDATLTPEFVKVKTDEGADIAYVTVSFYHQSGKLLDSQKLVLGEGKITTTVNAPTKVGFDFLGWSAKASGATAEDVVDFETATFSENTSLYPVFKAQDITYTLTVGLQTEQKAPQSSVTVTADPIEGKQFVGWKDANGNIVSYDSTYTFIITGDTTLEAYYEQVDSEVVKEPTIIIAQPTYEDITGGYKMSFYFNYTVPEDCKLVDIGIIRKKGDYAADGITLETDGVSQYSVLSKLGREGQFYYTKSNYYGIGHTVTGYMIYEKNGIRYTVYSDSIYGVKNN